MTNNYYIHEHYQQQTQCTLLTVVNYPIICKQLSNKPWLHCSHIDSFIRSQIIKYTKL